MCVIFELLKINTEATRLVVVHGVTKRKFRSLNLLAFF